jgi:hypothetical protein
MRKISETCFCPERSARSLLQLGVLLIAFYRKAPGTLTAQGCSEFSDQFGRKCFTRTLNDSYQCQGAHAHLFT